MMNPTNREADRLFAKADQKRRETKARKKAIKKLTPKEKVELIKHRYGLSHGGTKQNKKRRKK